MNKDQKKRQRREKKQRAYREDHKPKKKRAADPRWNMDHERGREVLNHEVALYALDGHPKCRKNPGMVGDRICLCAQKRFFAKNKDRITFDEKALVWWIKGKEPNAPKVEVEQVEVEAPAKGPEDEA